MLEPVPKSAGFGATAHRFSRTAEAKQQFNRDPGPASYSFQSPRSPGSKRGYPALASQDVRFRTKPAGIGQPGPAEYDNEKPLKHTDVNRKRGLVSREKHVHALLMKAFSAQARGAGGRPITVNVYFKGEVPSPGSYDQPVRPSTNAYSSHGNVFKGRGGRVPFEERAEGVPVGSYDTHERESLSRSYDVRSANFRPPCGRKKVRVNLYDPHAEPESQISPGPGHYFDPPSGMVGGREAEPPAEEPARAGTMRFSAPPDSWSSAFPASPTQGKP